jgi:lysophospholipase L1-like esterase
MKIVIFGDSVAKGIVTENGTIKTTKNNAVNLVSEYFGIEVDNISQYGQTVKRIMDKGIVDRYLESIPPQEQDLYAVIALGGNDSDYVWTDVEKKPAFDHPSKTPMGEFIVLYDELIKTLQKRGFRVIVSTIFPIVSRLFFDNVISQVVDAKAVLAFMSGDIETISRHQEAYNLAVIRLAEENHCPILDVRSGFLQVKNLKALICADGVHPNEEGYRFLADETITEIARSKEMNAWVYKETRKEITFPLAKKTLQRA